MPRHPPRALSSLTYSKARALRGALSFRACVRKDTTCSVGNVPGTAPAVLRLNRRPQPSFPRRAVGADVSALTQTIGLMAQADGAELHQTGGGGIRLGGASSGV